MLLAAVNVDLREWVDCADMEKKYFHCSSMVLLWDTHLAPADTMNQLSGLALYCQFLITWTVNTQQFPPKNI